MSILLERKTIFLKARIERNYAEYKQNITQEGSEIVFDLAADIVRVTEMYHIILKNIEDGNMGELSSEFLLEFDNPLTVLVEEWAVYSNDNDGEFLEFIEYITENGETGDYLTATEAEYLRGKHGANSTFQAVFLELMQTAHECAHVIFKVKGDGF